jgi:hypothetical protein
MPDRPAADAYVGRGGQQLLLPRVPFCPGRACQKACGPLECGCDPCRCATCRARRRPSRARLTEVPDLIAAFQPRPVQPPLFERTLA